LVNQKYPIKVKQTRISDEQKEEVKRILDDLLPIQSGQNWRYQEITDKTLYEQYTAEVENGKEVSKTFLIYKLLKQENTLKR
jgi:hypothetical protein